MSKLRAGLQEQCYILHGILLSGAGTQNPSVPPHPEAELAAGAAAQAFT